ncbi:MAG TPA: heme-binding protein [Novosphingobium sp.]|nr:heme-binding protein [Novosphingobium sp.]
MLLLAACGGGGSGGGGGGGGTPTPSPAPPPTPPVTGLYTAPAAEALSVADVQKIIAQAGAQAVADGRPAVIAVTDRVGNVLGIFRMTGAPAAAQIPPAPDGTSRDVQGLAVPAEAAALAKAITGAYLSSGGNAFSSRTASMIVQQHFPPAPSTVGLESGPLFGVQFSQLPCSDLAARFGSAGFDALIGPKRSPLGLAADPGGFPLYKNGVLVGGVGVLADGVYGFDPNVLDVDNDSDERIALAGTLGFEAPGAIRASQIYVDGTQLRYSDVGYAAVSGAASATYASISPTYGAPVALIGYTAAALSAGATYGSETSGIRRATASEFANSDAFVLTDGSGAGRYPIRAATDAGDVASPLTAAEASAILTQAFAVMSRARAQIRQPLDSRAQVSISLVDTRGVVLGLVRSPDAPLFGIDVSLQKARTAAFLSHARAASDLLADPSADVRSFVPAVRIFLNDPNALTGSTAFSARAVGNLARPYFPDGEVGRPNGPLSRPIAQFSPFSTGLQSALVLTNLAQHLNFATGAGATDTRRRCTFLPDAAPGQNRLQNGLQIFPGAVPIYRGEVLVGAIGVSGDGIDQDDMISFLGLASAGLSVGNAPLARRADTIVVPVAGGSVRLRYVSCPFVPFIGTSDQNVCQGL